MRFPRLLLMVLTLLLLTSAGCGSSREKGKTQDFDRPKSTGR